MNCKKIFECSIVDTLFYINFINKMKDRIGKTISVDTGQSIISQTSKLNNSNADFLMSMNTYGNTTDFEIALSRDIYNDGIDRFVLGVCPSCFNSSIEDINYRLDLATIYGVRHIGFWVNPENNINWWNAIRRWKNN